MSLYSDHEKYQRIIENIKQLPSLPTIVMRLMQVINSAESSAEDAAKLIEKDPALTSTILRIANSAFYGMPRSISSVASAVVILGFNTIRSIVLSATIMKAFANSQKLRWFNHANFWQHSIVCAMAARTLARECMSSLQIEPESAFCAGILHDIGKLIFEHYVPDEFELACRDACEQHTPLVLAEKKRLGIDHTDIGTILADKWTLPPGLEQAIVFHHGPQNQEPSSVLVAVVHCADQIAHSLGFHTLENEVIIPQWDKACAVIKLTEEEFVTCRQDVGNNLNKSLEYLSLVKI